MSPRVLVRNSCDECYINPTSLAFPTLAEDSMHQIPLYLLGKDHSERWTFALDVSEVKAPFLEFLRDACGLEVRGNMG